MLLRSEIDYGKRPMESVRWAGAVDNVGGEMLTWLTRTVDNWGNIASIGINSASTLRDTRLVVWNRIATDLKPRHLYRIATRTIAFAELPQAFDAYIKGAVTGRTVVKIGSGA